MMVRSPPRSSPSWGAFALPTASVSRRRSGTLLISVLLQLVSCAFLLLLPAAEVIGTSNSSISSPHHVLAAHARRHRSPPPLHYHQHGAGRVFSGGINKNIARCSESERAALLQFKAGLMLPDDNPPSNSTHARLSSWRGLDCCRGWEGVTCGNLTGGSVIKLDLRNWNLSSMMETTAMFSPLLRLKSSLRYLDLSSNPFHHYKDHNPIPAFFGSFEELRYLNLSHTSLAGTVPPQLGNLSRLHYLDLSGIAPDGSSSLRVDSLQWVSGLSRLRYLSLDNVDLSSTTATTAGTLDWVQPLNERLPLLAELHLRNCGLRSIAPSLDYTNFTSLEVVDLSRNLFSSAIPGWLPNISSLVYLDLSGNGLRGPIPVGGFSQLRHLDLGYNRNLNANISELLGCHRDWPRINTLRMPWTNSSREIPPSIGNITSLVELSLFGNSIVGELPPAIWRLPELAHLYVSGNQLSGVVTEAHLSSLGANNKLKTLDLGDNHLIVNLSSHWIPPFQLNRLGMASCQLGPAFPPWIKSQRELTYIDLARNGISDELPTWFWDLPSRHNLEGINLSENNLTGSIPSTNNSSCIPPPLDLGENHLTVNLSSHWIPPFQLNRLGISLCHLGPAFPPYIDLARNGISDVLTTWFWDLPSRHNLEGIDLSENNLTGSIPMSIGELQNLRLLDLSGNHLTGGIPVSIGKLHKLYVLKLSKNNLTGGIPTSIGEMDALLMLDLRQNNLVGGIPASIGGIGGLRYLDLSNNNLVGGIPSSIGEIGGLQYLVLSNNNLVGSIPISIGGIDGLECLHLSNNNLVGGIPASIGGIGGLWCLDLSNNNLVGGIPASLGKLYESLRFLDLSGNKFSGDIPTALLNSSSLQVLNISGNVLSGKLPPFIHNLLSNSLEALDLGSNNLQGGIPTWIGEIQGLRILRLRSNMLSGGIPPQLSNLKSLQVLDLAKNNLTGLIPEQLGSLGSMLNATQLHSLSQKGIWYASGIIIHTKGLDLVFIINKGLPVTSIDLSQNKLSGRFPESLTNLSGLKALNLSRNFLTGTIPERIGNMRELESLDLSSNHFVGRLPPSMSSMSFLGSLNLSHNNFSGEIPAGGHLDTFRDASFSGNPYLCGRFIERECTETKNNNNPPPQQVDGVNGGGGGTSAGEDWFYLGLGLGFAFGLLGPFLTMAAKRGWSEAYFRVVDMIVDRLSWARRRRC